MRLSRTVVGHRKRCNDFSHSEAEALALTLECQVRTSALLAPAHRRAPCPAPRHGGAFGMPGHRKPPSSDSANGQMRAVIGL
jgi:hypothetical protein